MIPRSHDLAMRRLAAAVIACAMYDAAGLAETHHGHVRGEWMSVEEVAREAYAWLTTESERLEFWAEAAGLDMQTVIDGADAAIDYARRTPRTPDGVGVWTKARKVRK